MEHPKRILKRHGLSPKRSLGQNFLFDDNVLAQIAGSADLMPSDQVLEIGPGLGALTRHLAKLAERVVAIELDKRLLAPLRDSIDGYQNVRIIHGNILNLETSLLFRSAYKVVANIPYYITGAILRHLLTADHKPDLVVLVVQREVAERIAAASGKMTLLSASVQFYGQVRILERIKAGAFWPRPDVDSVVMRIDLQPTFSSTVNDEQAFFRLVRVGFGQKRKQLQKNLRALNLSKGEVAAILNRAQIEGHRRAETLDLEEWVSLYESAGAYI